MYEVETSPRHNMQRRDKSCVQGPRAGVKILSHQTCPRRSIEERPGFAAALQTLGGVGGHVGAQRSIEERPGLAGALRALGGVGGHVVAPHLI